MINIFILCAAKSHPLEQNERMHLWLMWACKKPGTYKTESLLWDSIANHYNHDLLFSPLFVFSRENVKFNKKGVELRTCDIAQTSEFRLLSLWTNSFGLTIQTKRIWPRENELRERIPVPHDNFLKSIWSSRTCCEGYFCLLFPWTAWSTFTWTWHVSLSRRQTYKVWQL